MPLAQVAAGHYEPDGQGDGRKFLVNYYAEPNPQDPARPMRLVTAPGSRAISTLTAIRGIAQADGHASGRLLVVDGTALKAMDRTTEALTTLTGTVAGTDLVQWAFAETEAGLLANGAIYVSTGTAVAAATDADWASLLSAHGQSAFTSIATLGQRLIASYGSQFAFSLALDFNNTTALNFYTAESAPDGIVAVSVLGTTLYVFGTSTIEPWMQTGNDDDPFAPITGGVIQRGCAGRDTIVALDNTLVFVGDDRRVYRLGQGAVSDLTQRDPWVVRHLAATAAEDIVCEPLETEGNAFYVIRTPTLCMVLNLRDGTFHIRESYLQATWDFLHHVRVGSRNYAASATKLVELSRDYADDAGTAIVREFTAHLPVLQGRRPISSVRLDGMKGVGLVSGQGSDPLMGMAISRDNGLTFGSFRERALGKIGEYGMRTIWRRCGRARPDQVVLRFRCSEPVKHAITAIAVNEI